MIFTNSAILFLTALIVCLLLTPASIWLAHKLQAVDAPDARKVHDLPKPRLGGIAIALSLLLTCFMLPEFSPVLQALLLGLVVIVITGVTDDLWHIPPWLKFCGEIGAALLFILLSGSAIYSFGDLLGNGPITTGRAAVVVSVFCMIGVMNAMNMADGLDGLAAGISLIACAFLAWFAFISGQQEMFSLLLILAGSLIGFLYFNRHPARTFMGDSGSLLLGYVLSAVCIQLVQVPAPAALVVQPVSMAIVMGLPIVDAILVMSLRIGRGLNPFHPDNTHLHHRLLSFQSGQQTRVVWMVYLLMFSCGLLAAGLRHLPEFIQFYVGVACAIAIFGTVYYLHRRQ